MNILTVISLFRDKKQLIGRHTQVSCFSKHSFFSAFHLIFLIETMCEAGSLFYRVHHFFKTMHLHQMLVSMRFLWALPKSRTSIDFILILVNCFSPQKQSL